MVVNEDCFGFGDRYLRRTALDTVRGLLLGSKRPRSGNDEHGGDRKRRDILSSVLIGRSGPALEPTRRKETLSDIRCI